MKAFVTKSILLTIIVLALGGILYATVLRPYYLPVLPVLLIFFTGFTNLIHSYFLKSVQKAGAKFSARYMAVSFIKMFFYLAVAVVYVIFNREHAGIFLVNFMILYIVFTVFEISELRKVVKQVK